MPAKNLTFFFRKNEDSEQPEKEERRRTYHGTPEASDIYHTVGGRRRRGLVIDPGAANGLIGAETLRDLLEHIDKAKQVKETLLWKPKQSEATGISGAADATLGEVTMALPMIPGLESARYKADVIGGEASMCPALVGNPALVNMKAVLASNWFSNKDGLLIIPDGESGMRLIRLLFTDSRRYLLPLDSENDNANAPEDFEKAKTFLTRVEARSRERWSDVRAWFAWATTPKRKRSQATPERVTGDNDIHNEKRTVQFAEEFPTATPTTSSENAADSGNVAAQSSLDNEFPTATTTSRENATDSGLCHSDRVPHAPPGDQIQYSTQALTDEILASATIEAKFDAPTMYPGDCYPMGICDEKAQKLNRQYKAIHEEYYTKSGYLPVTPENFPQWRQTTRARRKTQF